MRATRSVVRALVTALSFFVLTACATTSVGGRGGKAKLEAQQGAKARKNVASFGGKSGKGRLETRQAKPRSLSFAVSDKERAIDRRLMQRGEKVRYSAALETR